jgi:hypothetical protein
MEGFQQHFASSGIPAPNATQVALIHSTRNKFRQGFLIEGCSMAIA